MIKEYSPEFAASFNKKYGVNPNHDSGTWKLWFAWKPVGTQSGKFRWLTNVYRRLIVAPFAECSWYVYEEKDIVDRGQDRLSQWVRKYGKENQSDG